MKNTLIIGCACLLAVETVAGGTPSETAAAPAGGGSRYGLFDWLDHRSEYGQGIYPEPFLVDDSDLEIDEARLDWLHTRAGDQTGDEVRAEVEKGFGLTTFELEVPYERDEEAGAVSEGVGNIDLGARCPFYQFVSVGGRFDTTLGAAIEVGIPVNSTVSRNTELVPKLFDDLKLGGHLTLQTVLGHSTLFGGGADGGLQVFEYGCVMGYTISRRELPLPGVLQLIPMFELTGETQLNQEDPGHNRLVGDAGFRINLKALGRVQPRLGAAFVFPMNSAGRDDVHCGVVTSLVFEY